MKFVIATHNPAKLAEMQRILAPLGIEAVTGEMLGITLTEAEETGETFAENAFLKADLACRETGLPAIADDSGLCVEALGGAPGVYSARFAPKGQYSEKLLEALKDVADEDRGAYFVSHICCVFPNGDTVTAEGRCNGVIGHEMHGTGGFGYDPVFTWKTGRTFAEMSAEEKDAISHRGVAMRGFVEKLTAYLSKRGTVYDQ